MKRFIYLLITSAIVLIFSAVECQSSVIPSYILKASEYFDVDAGLLYAICSVESRCQPGAINEDDATIANKARGVIEHSIGMFQLKLATARGLGFKGTKSQLIRPEVNTWYAAKLLRHLYNRYNDTPKVISAYNAGFYTRYNNRYVNLVLEQYIRLKLDRRL